MNEQLSIKTDELNNSIKRSVLYKKLIRSEKKMMNSEEVKSLAKIKDDALATYNHFVSINGVSSTMNEIYLKKLHLAKKNLEENKLVRKYLKYYSKYHLLLIDINMILFKDFKRELCQNKKIK